MYRLDHHQNDGGLLGVFFFLQEFHNQAPAPGAACFDATSVVRVWWVCDSAVGFVSFLIGSGQKGLTERG